MASILEIILRGKDAGATAAVRGLEKSLGGLKTILGGLGLGLGTAEMIRFGRESIAAAREAAAAEGELRAALLASGQASAEYQEQLEGLATALENTTNFTDEAIISAEASLVTYKNIGQDIMPQVVQVVADMGQKMGSLDAAAKLAGIALNVPEQAAARLQRQGILLTQQQKDQIAAMTEVGNLAGAQGVVLEALTTKYGGQAAAARDAAGGAQDYAVAAGRLQEAMGNLLLTIGDAGATDQAVGWMDKLTEGASAWTTVIEQMRLLSEAQAKLTAESGEAGGAISTVNAAMEQTEAVNQVYIDQIEALVGWLVQGSTEQEGFAEAIQEVAQASQDASPAIDAMTAAAQRSTLSAYQSMRGMMAQADAIRDVAAATQEVNQGQLDLRAAKESSPELGAKITENRKVVAEMARDKEEAEQSANQRAAKQMTTAFQQAADDIGNAISSKLTTTFQEVFKLPEGAADEVDEPARRLATVAAAGFGSEWLAQLNTQFTGQAFWQPMATAIASGDEGQLKTAATGILQQFSQGLITDLFDVNVIRAQVRAEMVQKRLKEQLIEEVKQGLGTAGVASAVGVVEVAAGNVGVATAQTETNVSTMAATAEAAGSQIQTAFAGAQQPVDILIVRIRELNNLLRETAVLSRNAAAGISGLNPPNAPAGNGVPNGAQRRMGGQSPL